MVIVTVIYDSLLGTLLLDGVSLCFSTESLVLVIMTWANISFFRNEGSSAWRSSEVNISLSRLCDSLSSLWGVSSWTLSVLNLLGTLLTDPEASCVRVEPLSIVILARSNGRIFLDECGTARRSSHVDVSHLSLSDSICSLVVIITVIYNPLLGTLLLDSESLRIRIESLTVIILTGSNVFRLTDKRSP